MLVQRQMIDEVITSADEGGEEEKGKPKFTEAELGKNPLATHLRIVAVRRTMPGQYTYDKQEKIMVNSEPLLERVPITKLYADSERRRQFCLLSARAKELLSWVMYSVKHDQDYVWINRKRFMQENQIKAVNTYKAAENELVVNHFLFHTTKTGVFWINPHYFFQGNRLEKYKDKVVEYEPKTNK